MKGKSFRSVAPSQKLLSFWMHAHSVPCPEMRGYLAWSKPRAALDFTNFCQCHWAPSAQKDSPPPGEGVSDPPLAYGQPVLPHPSDHGSPGSPRSRGLLLQALPTPGRDTQTVVAVGTGVSRISGRTVCRERSFWESFTLTKTRGWNRPPSRLASIGLDKKFMMFFLYDGSGGA